VDVWQCPCGGKRKVVAVIGGGQEVIQLRRS